ADVLGEQGLETLCNSSLAYGTFSGLHDLRSVIARQYETLNAEDVLIVNGASEAIEIFLRTNLQAGDEVVVQRPIFNSLRATAEQIGCRIVDWDADDPVTCRFCVPQLADLCSERTKLIVFNFPHNPSGQMIAESELRQICDIADRCEAMILSDEQFRLLELGSTQTLPAACDLSERAVSVCSVSKTLGMGGLRIGWLATRCREKLQRAKEYRYYTTEMTNPPCQLIAAAAIRKSHELLSQNRQRIQANVERMVEFCLAHETQMRLNPPAAGTMALVEQKTPLSSTEFCSRLLDDQRLFLVPGTLLGMSDRLLRFGFGREDFADGLERLSCFLQSSAAQLPTLH
ncbi:MAG: pyridoxal phosphate-dependent aminotransferase, partial [Planctomycetaceae bacterium]|nr:pyridoxal phosphate-dependent aminotransferase [Planctomycetaceae bacterium]